MNTLDRFIGYFSPQRGFARVAARARMKALGYAGADTTHNERNWRSPRTSANAEVGRANVSLRARARQLVRDNPHASRAVSVMVGHQIGTGIMPRCATTDEKLNTTVNELWRAWAGKADRLGMGNVYALQQIAARCRAESGEALVRLIRPDSGDVRRLGLPVPLQVEVLEPDYLDEGKTGVSPGRVVQGVELDAAGRKVAYHLLRAHPGDTYTVGSQTHSDRVSASDVLHVYRQLRPGQLRGVTDFAPVLLRMRLLDEYEEATLAQARVQATIAMSVTSDGEGTLGRPSDPNDKDWGGLTGSDGYRLETLTPGMIAYGKPGDEITMHTPSGAGAFEPFSIHSLMAIAAGLGLTYDQITGDLRQANYSSLRAGKIEFRRLMEQDQWLMFIPQLCEPLWGAFIEAAVLSGKLSRRDEGYPVEWTPPRFEMIDPPKEIGALRDAVRSGLEPWTEVVASLGYEPRWLADEIKRAAKLFDERGLILDSDPRYVNASGGAQDSAQNAAVQLRSREPSEN